MKQAIARRWIKALRSGEYRQGYYRLKDGDTYCCLGVLCAIGGFSVWSDNATLPLEVMHWAGMQDDCGAVWGQPTLSYLNDDERRTFPQIADYIEQHWREL